MSRLPIPEPLKRLLVPVWNEAHRVGWLARDYATAVGKAQIQLCRVCGAFRPMLYRRRVIPPKLVERWGLTPRLAAALARKESSNCAGCGAKLRARRMAEVLLKRFTDPNLPDRPSSLRDWVEMAAARKLRVAEINTIEGLHDQLMKLRSFQASDFQPGVETGTVKEGVRSEDLMKLTYPDASFDLVLTSETLEHVPDLDTALREIHRVLVPGGWHIFTIPRLPRVATTFARARLRNDGSIEDLHPRICHPGGDVGYPVFTEFGADLPNRMHEAGFTCEVEFSPVSEDDLAQVYVCRKRDRAS